MHVGIIAFGELVLTGAPVYILTLNFASLLLSPIFMIIQGATQTKDRKMMKGGVSLFQF